MHSGNFEHGELSFHECDRDRVRVRREGVFVVIGNDQGRTGCEGEESYYRTGRW